MKKQYLISLLGFFAIFIPFGSGLVNTNLNSSNNEKTTGITMKETSKIFVIDKDNSNDVTMKDTINSISFDGEWTFENWGGKENYNVDNPSKEGLNLYSSQISDEPILEVSYKTLKNKGTSNLSEDSEILTYSIEANSLNNENVGIWGYQIGYEETFKITADYNSINEKEKIKEDNLGIIELALSDSNTIQKNSDANITSSTEANVSYTVTPRKGVDGEEVTIDEVKWMDGKNTLATSISKEKDGFLYATNLNQDLWYKDTIIFAEMSDGSQTNSVKIDDFKTVKINEPSEIKQVSDVDVTGPKTATVDYDVTCGTDKNSNPLTVKKVVWIEGWSLDGKSELAKDKVDEDGNGIDGTLEANRLNPGHYYDNTAIVAKMSDGSYTERVEIPAFKAGQDISTIEQNGPVNATSYNSASINYKIDEREDVDGHRVTVKEVKWMEGSNELDSIETTKDHGTLWTTNLQGYQWHQTTLKAKMSDGMWIECPVDEFWTDACEDPSTIEERGKVKVTSTTSAEVNYYVNTGRSYEGNHVSVKEVKWMDGDDELATSGATSGTLETDKLNTNQWYKNTTIQAEMSDGSSTNKVIIEPFQADPSNVDSTIKEVGEVNVTSSTEANVSYAITPGKDVNGNLVTVDEVKWIDGDDELATSKATSGTLKTDKLSPNQTYDNTKIIATMSDGSPTNEIIVESFQADPGNVDSTIKKVGKVEVTSSTEANVSYAITPGKDVDGKAVTVDEVKWIDGDDELATSKATSGTLKTNKLSPNQTYDNTKIIATMSDGSPTNEIIVESFQADPGNVDSTIKKVGKVEVTSSTEANVSYAITPGKDVDGKAVTVDEVKWMDGGNELATSKATSGTLKTDKLSPNQTYDNTKIIATMSDGSPTNEIIVESFQANPSLPTNEATAINIDEGNGILQIEGKITKNEATIKEINLIDIKTGNIVPTKCEITDNGDSISYSIFTDQYNGDINSYKLQVSYEINGETSNLEKVYEDIQYPDSITEYIDLSYLIDTDDLKLGWIIAGSLIVLILCIIAVGFFVF